MNLRRKSLLLLVAAAVVFLAPSGCSRSGVRRLNIVLITVDTLRADRLGCYGSDLALTPNIDRLAREGILFAGAIAPVPRTSQSVASLLTGLPPSAHGVHGHGEILEEKVVTVAEKLKKAHYRTAAVVTNYMLSGKGYNQGFDRYIHTHNEGMKSDARTVTDRAIAQLDSIAGGGEGPFFFWVHYIDPHWTYDPPDPHADRFLGRPRREAVDPFRAYARGKMTKGEILFRNRMSDEKRAAAEALYSGEIAFADHEIGRLLDAIRRGDLDSNTLVAFTSDHGESLGENDYYYGHGEYLYDVTLRVPLIVRFPAGGRARRAGVVREGWTRLYDLLPALAAEAGTPIGGKGVDDLAGKEEVFSESDFRLTRSQNPRQVKRFEDRWRAVRKGRWKLIRIPGGGQDRFELYDLVADPAEEEDVSAGGRNEAVIARLADDLRRHEEEYPSRPGRTGQDTLSRTDMNELKALGYIH